MRSHNYNVYVQVCNAYVIVINIRFEPKSLRSKSLPYLHHNGEKKSVEGYIIATSKLRLRPNIMSFEFIGEHNTKSIRRLIADI